MSKGTFSERLEEILGDDAESTITLHRSGDRVMVRVAISTEDHGVLKQSRAIPMGNKLTPHKLLSAAEDAHGTLTTSIGIFAASTPDFSDES